MPVVKNEVVQNEQVPRMNGWEMLAALRKLVRGLPVILASGYGKACVMPQIIPNCPGHS